MKFNNIDILKFIFAIFIVILHTDIFHDQLIETFFFRLAVPFFFVCSGFFLNKKLLKYPTTTYSEIFSSIKQYIKRLGVFLLIFEPLVLLINMIGAYYATNDFKEVIIQAIRYIIFYPLGALWYIQAVIIASLMLIPFLMNKRIKWAVLIGIPLFLFALISNRYYFAAPQVLLPIINQYIDIFITPRNGVFVGFFYMSIGCYIAFIYQKIAGYKTNNILCLTILFSMIYIIEILLIRQYPGIDDNSIYITQPILVSLIFIYATKIKSINNTTKSILLRNLSTSIYLIHYTLIMFWRFSYKFITGKQISNIYLLVIVSICIFITLYIIYKKKPEPIYSWIK